MIKKDDLKWFFDSSGGAALIGTLIASIVAILLTNNHQANLKKIDIYRENIKARNSEIKQFFQILSNTLSASEKLLLTLTSDFDSSFYSNEEKYFLRKRNNKFLDDFLEKSYQWNYQVDLLEFPIKEGIEEQVSDLRRNVSDFTIMVYAVYYNQSTEDKKKINKCKERRDLILNKIKSIREKLSKSDVEGIYAAKP